MPEGDDLPRHGLRRTARLARLPLGAAGRATVGLGRRMTGTPADIVSAEQRTRTAEQLFEVLGQLKGGAMKVGQVMSLMEAGLPDEIAGPYREMLTKLQDSAPGMSTATVTQQLERGLGPDWRDWFDDFDTEPAAAASIGQVHRGRLTDGRTVAVKVQYPGAAQALRADLRQMGRLATAFGSWVPGLELKPLIAEAQERVTEELDYIRESEAQQAFADAFAGDEEFLVPNVVAASTRVIVSEWVDGPSLAAVIRDGSQADRDHFGEAYVRFLFSGPKRAGLLHGDPHPGNFKTQPDGRLGVVDFGLCARLPDGMPRAVGRLLRISLSGDGAAVEAGLREEGFIKPRMTVDPQALMDYLAPLAEPAAVDRFAFSREWLRAQVARNTDLSQPHAALAVRLNLPPDYLLIHRVWLGGMAVLCQLHATAPYREVLTELLPGFADD